MATRTAKKPSKPHTKNGLLTDQHKLFISAYMRNQCSNAKAAAIEAGVPEKSAGSVGSVWLNSDKYPQISAYLEAELERIRNTSGVTHDRIVQEYARIFFFNPKRLLKPEGKGTIDLKDMPDDVAACIKNVHISFSEEENEDGSFTRVKHFNYTLHDKLGAGAGLCRVLGIGEGDKVTPNGGGGTTNILINFDQLYAGQATSAPIPLKNAVQEELAREIAALNAAPTDSSPPEKPMGPPQLIINNEDKE